MTRGKRFVLLMEEILQNLLSVQTMNTSTLRVSKLAVLFRLGHLFLTTSNSVVLSCAATSLMYRFWLAVYSTKLGGRRACSKPAYLKSQRLADNPYILLASSTTPFTDCANLKVGFCLKFQFRCFRSKAISPPRITTGISRQAGFYTKEVFGRIKHVVSMHCLLVASLINNPN